MLFQDGSDSVETMLGIDSFGFLIYEVGLSSVSDDSSDINRFPFIKVITMCLTEFYGVVPTCYACP